MGHDGDGRFGDNGAGEDDGSDGDGEGEAEGDSGEVSRASAASPSTEAAATQKKCKRPNRKRPKKKGKGGLKQSSPPRVPLSQLFPSGEYPAGEIQSYSDRPADLATVDHCTARTTAAELRYNSRQRHWEDDTFVQNYRKAAEVHRQTRRWVQETAKPGQTLQDIASGIEDSVRALLDNAGLGPGDGLKSGMGFPTGLCLNHQVAHYTPNPGQKPVVLQQQDVLTVDFGVHINGWIVDSAFTMAFDPTYDNLLAAVKDATNTGVKVRDPRHLIPGNDCMRYVLTTV
jgi:methionyl aminopeptidase